MRRGARTSHMRGFHGIASDSSASEVPCAAKTLREAHAGSTVARTKYCNSAKLTLSRKRHHSRRQIVAQPRSRYQVSITWQLAATVPAALSWEASIDSLLVPVDLSFSLRFTPPLILD